MPTLWHALHASIALGLPNRLVLNVGGLLSNADVAHERTLPPPRSVEMALSPLLRWKWASPMRVPTPRGLISLRILTAKWAATTEYQ